MWVQLFYLDVSSYLFNTIGLKEIHLCIPKEKQGSKLYLKRKEDKRKVLKPTERPSPFNFCKLQPNQTKDPNESGNLCARSRLSLNPNQGEARLKFWGEIRRGGKGHPKLVTKINSKVERVSLQNGITTMELKTWVELLCTNNGGFGVTSRVFLERK